MLLWFLNPCHERMLTDQHHQSAALPRGVSRQSATHRYRERAAVARRPRLPAKSEIMALSTGLFLMVVGDRDSRYH